MRPCINQLTTKTTPFDQDVEAYARAGFDAVEVFLPKVEAFCETHSYEQARRLLRDHGLEVVGACGGVMGMMLCQGEAKRTQHALLRKKLEQCENIGATQVNMVADFPAEPSMEHYELARQNLTEAAELAASHGVQIAVEFVAWSHFLAGVPTTQQLIRSVAASNVGIMFDSFHFYKGHSKFSDLEELGRGDIAFVHINDAPNIPREVVTDQDRVIPGQGVLPLKRILEAVRATGYDGPVSAELLNPQLWEIEPETLARSVYQAVAALCHAVGD
jgi:sugar phosphate isomerase/epimerase